MTWTPGNQRYYNEQISPRITFGLGQAVGFMNDETPSHPGLYLTRGDDLFTDSLDVRPRLQTQAVNNPQSSKVVAAQKKE